MFIQIFAAGGTIDKIYFDAKSDYEVGEPNIKKLLDGMNLSVDYTVTSLLRKDSLDLTDEDRQTIFEAVAQCDSNHIIITHGTDTMVDTAKPLAALTEKTIVFTGAMEPAMYVTSDAVFNIGCAMAAVQTLSPGCYIAMNGRIFDCDQVRKNRDAGRFELL